MIKGEIEPRPRNFEKSFGHKIEEIIGSFLKQSFPDLFTIERQEPNSPNDAEHVDLICRFGENCLFGVDVTADRSKLIKKIKGIKDHPMARLEDKSAKPTGERAPKVVYFEGRTGLWLDHQIKAEQEGVNLIDTMPHNEVVARQIKFLEEILTQSNAFVNGGEDARINGQTDRKEYEDSMAPIREIFQRKLEELKVAA